MSAEIREWFAMDVEFIGSPKVQAAIKDCPASLQLWLAMRSFVRRRRLESGEVPASNVDCLEGGPKRWRAALSALERNGLVERVEGGWYMHDFHQHASELAMKPEKPARGPEAEVPGETAEERKRRLARNRQWARRHGGRDGAQRDAERDTERDSGHAASVTPSVTANPLPHTPSPDQEQDPDPSGREKSKDLPGSSGLSKRDADSSPRAALRDPFGASLVGGLPHQRADVARVVSRFAELASLPNVRIRAGDFRGQLVVDALEQFGEQGCLDILDQAQRDDTVNGRGDAAGGTTHWTLEYLFKPTTAERLYAAAASRRKRATRRARVAPTVTIGADPLSASEVGDLLAAAGLKRRGATPERPADAPAVPGPPTAPPAPGEASPAPSGASRKAPGPAPAGGAVGKLLGSLGGPTQ